jgi:hypothetical protein
VVRARKPSLQAAGRSTTRGKTEYRRS